MYIDINELPPSSKVWIYQADRFLSKDELSLAEVSLRQFVDSWLSHSMLMKGSFKVLNNRILVIAVDNGFQDASGCSIDSMTRWLKKLGSEIGSDFFDRSIGYFKDKTTS